MLGTLFSIFSFSMLVPFLDILFKQTEGVYEKVAWSFDTSAIKNNAYFYLNELIREEGEVHALLWVCLFLVGSILLKTFCMYMGNYVNAPLENNIVKDVYNMLYKKIISLPVGYFTEEKKGDILARVSTDIAEIKVSIVASVAGFIKHPIQILFYLAMLLIISPLMTGFILIMLPISGFVIGRIGKSLRKSNKKALDMQGELLSAVEETLAGLRVIQAFNATLFMRDRFEEKSKKLSRLSIGISRRYTLASPFSEFMGSMIIAATIMFGGSLVLSSSESALEPSTFIAYIVFFSQIISPAKAFSSVFYKIQKGAASIDRINKILHAESEVVETTNPKPLTGFNDKIEFKNVSFSYGEKQVLKNVSFTLHKGQSIALVGKSGSGKTTIANLLPRFYHVKDGDILIDGVSIKDFKLEDLRALIGVVTQESILFNDTFSNNIAFGMENASESAITEAAKVANAHEFIVEKEESYQTNIGDGGGKLSGGQRQRVSIARAVLKNPPILILDEATSALDTHSEKQVQDALLKLMANRSSLVIAHRLSTIKNADVIMVMSEGKIIETGSHDELLAKNGAYRELYNMQLD